MPPKPIVREPNSVLHRRALAVPVEGIPGAKIQRLISDMKAALAAAPDGVGLAAPQVGEALRIFIVSEEAEAIIDANEDAVDVARPRVAAKTWQYHVFVNPVLVKRSRRTTRLAEGCLSLPGKFGEVARAEKVSIEWRDELGKKHARGFTRFFARVIQHEFDHLEGVLIADRAQKMHALPPHG